MFMGFKRLTRRRRELLRKKTEERKALDRARRRRAAVRRKSFSKDLERANALRRRLNRREIEGFLATPHARGVRAKLGTFPAAVLLHLRGEPRPAQEKLKKLLRVSAYRAPKLLAERNLGAFLLLMNDPWLRPLDEWKPRGKSNDAIMRSLVEHLVVKRPIPRFLYSVYTADGARTRDACARIVFNAAANGWSVHRAFKNHPRGPVLTRAMCGMFMSRSDGMTFHEAVRTAQVVASGGNAGLAAALRASVLGRGFVGEERLWFAAIEWLSGLEDVDCGRLGEIIDYLNCCFEVQPDFSFKGRTWAAMARAVERWHKDLSSRKSLENVRFRRSGIKEGAWISCRRGPGGEMKESRWTIREILTGDDLFSEGSAMRHCVASYARNIESGDTSIWSLRRDDERMLTIEVSNKLRRIVQARGRCQRDPEPWELRVLGMWAAKNRMKAALFE